MYCSLCLVQYNLPQVPAVLFAHSRPIALVATLAAAALAIGCSLLGSLWSFVYCWLPSPWPGISTGHFISKWVSTFASQTQSARMILQGQTISRAAAGALLFNLGLKLAEDLFSFPYYEDNDRAWQRRLGVCSDEMVADMLAAAVVATAAVIFVDRLERLRV